MNFFFLFPENSPRDPIGRVLSLPCIIGFKKISPRRSMIFFCVGGGVVWGGVGVSVLPFGTLDYARTIIFRFLVL